MLRTLPAGYRGHLDTVQKLRGRHEALTEELARAEFTVAAAILRDLFGTAADGLVVNKTEDVHGTITIQALVVLDSNARPLWFNDQANYDCGDYPGAEKISDDRGRPLVTLDSTVINTITGHLEDGYVAFGGATDPLDVITDEHFPYADSLLGLDIGAALDPSPPADTTPPAEDTANGWVARWLQPGDRIGAHTLADGEGGFELWDGSRFVHTTADVAQFGHTVASKFDPPSTDIIQAAGLDSTGCDGTVPFTWKDVAQASLARSATGSARKADTPGLASSTPIDRRELSVVFSFLADGVSRSMPIRDGAGRVRVCETTGKRVGWATLADIEWTDTLP